MRRSEGEELGELTGPETLTRHLGDGVLARDHATCVDELDLEIGLARTGVREVLLRGVGVRPVVATVRDHGVRLPIVVDRHRVGGGLLRLPERGLELSGEPSLLPDEALSLVEREVGDRPDHGGDEVLELSLGHRSDCLM